jgi:hypothetical protein
MQYLAVAQLMPAHQVGSLLDVRVLRECTQGTAVRAALSVCCATAATSAARSWCYYLHAT